MRDVAVDVPNQVFQDSVRNSVPEDTGAAPPMNREGLPVEKPLGARWDPPWLGISVDESADS
jgi:hypothetical protein